MVHFKASTNPHPLGITKIEPHLKSQFTDRGVMHPIWSAEEIASVKKVSIVVRLFIGTQKQISGPPLCPSLGSRRGGHQPAQCNLSTQSNMACTVSGLVADPCVVHCFLGQILVKRLSCGD
jgi:hypothetical protein